MIKIIEKGLMSRYMVKATKQQESANRRTFLKVVGASSTISLTGCLGGEGEGGGGNGNGTEDGGAEDNYPTDTIQMVVPYGAGGGTDSWMRQLMTVVSEILDVSIGIENIEGASGMRGIGEVHRAEPDGYTLVAFNPPSAPVAAMVLQPDFDMREMKGVATYSRNPIVIAANVEHNIEDLADMASRYQEGDLETIGSADVGGMYHVLTYLLKDHEGYDINWSNYIGYDGSGPVGQALLSNEIPVGVLSEDAAQGPVEDGRVEPIATTYSEGSGIFPDIPSTVEEGYPNIDYIGQTQRGIYAPPNTPDERIQVFAEAVEEALQTDEIQNWAEDAGHPVNFGPPEEAESAVQDAFDTIPNEVNLDEIREEAN